MAHPKQTRERLRRAFVTDRLSLEVAALKTKISYATAARWKAQALTAGGDWDKARAGQLMSDGGIEAVARQVLAGLVTQYQATMQAVTDDAGIEPAAKVQMLASLADAYNKTVSASKRILPETSELATAMQVVQHLAGFIRERFPQHRAAFAEVLEPFGEALTGIYGS